MGSSPLFPSSSFCYIRGPLSPACRPPPPIGFGCLNGSRSPSRARCPCPTRWLPTPSPLCALTPGSAASLHAEAPAARDWAGKGLGHLGGDGSATETPSLLPV